MTHVYIVRRESADGPENDVFTDWELAKEWAAEIGSTVEEEGVLNRADIDAMKATL